MNFKPPVLGAKASIFCFAAGELSDDPLRPAGRTALVGTRYDGLLEEIWPWPGENLGV